MLCKPEGNMKLLIQEAADNSGTTLRINYQNDMTRLPYEIKNLRDTLEELHVDNNYRLTQLSPFLGDLPHLRTLDARYCRLDSVSAQVCSLHKLETLYLSNNTLRFLPTEMWQLKRLEALRVDNNKLRVLPGSLLFLPRLREVTLENNPLYTPEEVKGAAAVTLVPDQLSVDCANCCVRVRNYLVAVSFHRLLRHREVPFVHFLCSEDCKRHLDARLATYDAEAERGYDETVVSPSK